MTNEDKLELAEKDLALVDALTRAVAYGSPSPLEELRADFNRRVLDLRGELNLDEHDEPVAEDVAVEDPAEEDDAFEEHPGDTDLLEPQPDQAPPVEAPAEAQGKAETPAPVAEGVSEPAVGDTPQA